MNSILKIQFGKSIPNKLISRCDVAEDSKGRVIPLFDNVMAVFLFYHEDRDGNKGVYFCTEEEAIQAGVAPKLYYCIPVARLNTDAKGKVLDDSIKLEYLRPSAQQYNDLISDSEELEQFNSIYIAKQKKREFSFIVMKPSGVSISPEVLSKVETLRNSLNEDQIFAMALADIARPFKMYIERFRPDLLSTPVSEMLPSYDEELAKKEIAKLSPPSDDDVFNGIDEWEEN